jgi:hypothetical protein
MPQNTSCFCGEGGMGFAKADGTKILGSPSLTLWPKSPLTLVVGLLLIELPQQLGNPVGDFLA